MFYKKLSFNLSKYAFNRFLRTVCVSSKCRDVQISKGHSGYRNYKCLLGSIQNQQHFLEQNITENNWDRENRKHNSETYFLKLLKFLPAVFIASLVSIHSALCLKDSPIEEGKLDKNDSTTKDQSPKEGPTSKKEKTDKSLKTLPNSRNYTIEDSLTLKGATDLARCYVSRKISEAGAPGIAVAVSVNGRLVWSEGIGFSDLENGVRMSPFTVMRIASISKSLTATAMGQLIDEGKLDLDAPIQKYVPSFPEKTYDGEKVIITTRHLLTHTSGIRHYQLKEEIEADKNKESKEEKHDTIQSTDSKESKNEKESGNIEDNAKTEKEKENKDKKNKNKSVEDHSKTEKENSSKLKLTDKEKENSSKLKLTDKEKENSSKLKLTDKEKDNKIKFDEKRKKMRDLLAEKALATKSKSNKKTTREFDLEEYYLKEEFHNLEESLQLFKDDELLFKPGTNYHYSSHAFTLASAVVQKLAGKQFPRLMKDLFQNLNMQYTFLDKNDDIIYRRGRYYLRNKNGFLMNAPYVNNSYKWAGGGFLSNVFDMITFGNVMLYAYQNVDNKEPKGFLKSSTVRQLWTSSPESEKYGKGHLYGLGWSIGKGAENQIGFAYNKKFYASHSGGAVGASSVLLIMPSYDPYDKKEGEDNHPILARGIVVSIITNLQGVPLTELAVKIARIFDRVPNESEVVGNVCGILKNKVYSLEKS